jgi:uncharacterized membrane protein
LTSWKVGDRLSIVETQEEHIMETQEEQQAEAADALKQIADSRAALAERLIPPRWYYPALGAMAGGFIATLALPAGSWITVAIWLALGFGVGGWLLPRAYRKATGFSVTRPPGARSLRWLIALVLVALAFGAAGGALKDVWGWVGPVLAGVVAVPVITVIGRRYDAALRADVRGHA